MKFFITSFFVCIIFVGCIKKYKNDSKIELDYQGYSDTTVALLYGKLLDFNQVPIIGASIKTKDNLFSTITDEAGFFELFTSSGTYDVFIHQANYQTVLLKGYVSHSDQITRVNIKLSPLKSDTLEFDASKKQ